MRFFIRFFSLLGLIILIACVSARYTPPVVDNSEKNYSRIINKSFDDTWSALIRHSASTFFGIENFEKESGLITLSFGSSNPSEFITGGLWEVADYSTNPNAKSFKGDYVEYLYLYLGATLDGKMNIVVIPIDENKTRVTVNARYVFSYRNVNGSMSWSFDSGGCDERAPSNRTKGTPKTRTICPTYVAEQAVLTAIENIK